MITLSDQIKLSLPLSLDSRQINISLSGSMITIETIEDYLKRVDINSRYVGMEVLISSPPGDYQINAFIEHLKSENISAAKYKFANINDDGLMLVTDSVVVVNDLTTGGISDALSAQQGVELKSIIDNLNFIDIADAPNSYVDQKDKTIRVKIDETGIEFINRTYLFDQGIPSQIWNITHNLDKYPSVVVKTSAGDTVEGFINYVNKDSVTIIFNSAFSGTAILN